MAKWVALIFVAAYSLQLLAYHGWAELAVLWLSVALAYGFVQVRGAGPELAWLTEWTSRWRSKRSLSVVPGRTRARWWNPRIFTSRLIRCSTRFPSPASAA